MWDRALVSLRSLGFGNQRTVPSLDGLRAVSIAFVLAAHISGTRNFPNFLAPLGAMALFGVRVFFVISGYLITSILLAELARSGTISLSRFYFRRTLRLFPAAYVFIGVTALLAANHRRLVGLEPGDLTYALTYTMNYHEARNWSLGHLWSLAVEEQFYVLWPITLKLIGVARSTRFMFYVLAIVPFLRLLAPRVTPALNFVVWCDALATGCLMAILWKDLHKNQKFMRLLSSRWFFIVPLIAVSLVYVPKTRIVDVFSGSIMNVAIALCIFWSIDNAKSGIGRFLNLPLVSFVGVLSYSLYLWQQMFLNQWSQSRFSAFPINILLAITAALASYLLVEVPALRYRAALERKIELTKLPKTAGEH